MKSVLPFIILFFSTMMSAVIVMVILMLAEPELFGAGASPGNAGTVALPVSAEVRPRPPGMTSVPRDSVNPAPATVDSLAALRHDLARLQDSLASTANVASVPVSERAAAETTLGAAALQSPAASAEDCD